MAYTHQPQLGLTTISLGGATWPALSMSLSLHTANNNNTLVAAATTTTKTAAAAIRIELWQFEQSQAISHNNFC